MDSLFALRVSPLELLIRATAVYWFLFIIFRFVIRRDVASVGLSDFLFVVLVGGAVRVPLLGEGRSLLEGFISVVGLVTWNLIVDFVTVRVPLFRRFALPPKLALFEKGHLVRRNLRRELITVEEVEAKVREAGLQQLADAHAIYLEPDGEISIVKR